MKIEISKKDRLIIIKLNEAKLGSNLSPLLKSEIVMAGNEGFRNMVVDLHEVRYIDSSGLSALLVGKRICEDATGRFVLTGLNTNVQKLIEISQLVPVLDIMPEVDEAIDFIMKEELARDLRSA